jgi:hypothetical protein
MFSTYRSLSIADPQLSMPEMRRYAFRMRRAPLSQGILVATHFQHTALLRPRTTDRHVLYVSGLFRDVIFTMQQKASAIYQINDEPMDNATAKRTIISEIPQMERMFLPTWHEFQDDRSAREVATRVFAESIGMPLSPEELDDRMRQSRRVDGFSRILVMSAIRTLLESESLGYATYEQLVSVGAHAVNHAMTPVYQRNGDEIGASYPRELDRETERLLALWQQRHKARTAERDLIFNGRE